MRGGSILCAKSIERRFESSLKVKTNNLIGRENCFIIVVVVVSAEEEILRQKIGGKK